MTEHQALEALIYDQMDNVDPRTMRLLKAAFDLGQRTPVNASNVEFYSADQQRVADWLIKRMDGQVGAGTDPIGFLMASYELMSDQVTNHQKLWNHCTQFVTKNNIYCAETVYQVDRVIINAYEFIEGVCDIVGYQQLEDE